MLSNFEYPKAVSDAGYALDLHNKVKSMAVVENIPFGRVVGSVALDGNTCQLPSANRMVLSADTVASNVINGSVSVITYDSLGVETITTTAISPVTFATSHLVTMGLVKAAIEAVNTKLTATIDTADATNRTMYVTHSDNSVVILSLFVITLGASQATVSYNFFGKIRGISIIANRQPDSLGIRQYKATDCAGVVSQGRVVIKAIDATDINSSLFYQFIDFTGSPRGTIRTSTASGRAIALTGYIINNQAVALGANIMELNQP